MASARLQTEAAYRNTLHSDIPEVAVVVQPAALELADSHLVVPIPCYQNQHLLEDHHVPCRT